MMAGCPTCAVHVTRARFSAKRKLGVVRELYKVVCEGCILDNTKLTQDCRRWTCKGVLVVWHEQRVG
jgi:hypothetical protein